MREWIWEVNNTSPYVYEKNEPLWYNSKAHLQISQFTNWEEVAQKHYPYYVLPHNFSETIPPEMQALVNQWKETTQDVYKRALLAVRFVQDKVCYLGLEEGVGRVQPNPPSMTFQRRFGDCKDKTFLLHALLRLMDIPSTPLLVHTNQGKRLPEALPFLFAFNHAVLQIEIDGIPYFVDSTINLQGGSLQTNFFPNFEWGLLLDPNTTTLTALPKIVPTKPAECESTIIIETEDSARLKIKSTSHNSRADNLRRSLERNGLKKISRDFLSQMQEVYGMVSVDSPMKIVDDRENNILVLTESYHIPTQKLSDKKVLQVFSHILSNYLHSKVNPARTSPYALPYPLWIRESIHIENPFFEWNLLEEYYTQEHESLLYNLSTQIEGHHAQFDIELKHLQDHIPQAALQDYWNIVKDIEWKALPRMIISSLDFQEESNSSQTHSESANN